MSKKENEQILPIPTEIPTIKKIVNCPKCGSKIEVEFEIELEALIPATLADTLAEVGQPVEEKKKADDDGIVPIPPVKEGMKDYGG